MITREILYVVTCDVAGCVAKCDVSAKTATSKQIKRQALQSVLRLGWKIYRYMGSLTTFCPGHQLDGVAFRRRTNAKTFNGK